MTKQLMLVLVAIDTLGVMFSLAIFFIVDNKVLAVAPMIVATIFMVIAIVVTLRKKGPLA